MQKQILSYALKYQGEWHQITKAIKDQEPWVEQAYDGHYITILDDAYPKRLKRLRYPPWILFYEGNLSYLEGEAIGVVGARECGAYGKQLCQHVVRLLKNRCVIVSGLAKGIDAIAHMEALDHATIAVIGCGLNVSYPKENASLYASMKQTQLILSEYPNGVKPLAHHFPWRNRLIAALSSAIVVVEAKQRSGTLLTVNEALELDIPIYCFPFPFLDPQGAGCNLLISQGANILVDDQDILAIL